MNAPNHEKDNIFEALGFEEKELDRIYEIVSDSFKPNEENTKTVSEVLLEAMIKIKKEEFGQEVEGISEYEKKIALAGGIFMHGIMEHKKMLDLHKSAISMLLKDHPHLSLLLKMSGIDPSKLM